MTNHKIGDIVTPNPDAGWARKMIGTTYKITDVPRGARGVNFKASPCDADGNEVAGQGLRGPGWSLVAYDPSSPLDNIPEPPAALPPVGSIVKSEGPQLPAGFYTVIGHTDATRVRAIQIGDTSGRYYRAAASRLTVLDAGDVLAALDLGGL